MGAGMGGATPDPQSAMVGLAHIQALGLKTMVNQQRELMTFLGRRYEQDLRLFDRIIAAKEPQAIVEAVSAFYQDAAKDYSTQLTRTIENAPHVAADTGEALAEAAQAFTDQRTHATAE